MNNLISSFCSQFRNQNDAISKTTYYSFTQEMNRNDFTKDTHIKK